MFVLLWETPAVYSVIITDWTLFIWLKLHYRIIKDDARHQELTDTNEMSVQEQSEL